MVARAMAPKVMPRPMPSLAGDVRPLITGVGFEEVEVDVDVGIEIAAGVWAELELVSCVCALVVSKERESLPCACRQTGSTGARRGAWRGR